MNTHTKTELNISCNEHFRRKEYRFPHHFKLANRKKTLLSFEDSIKVFVYEIKVNPIRTILKYGDYHDFMDR